MNKWASRYCLFFSQREVLVCPFMISPTELKSYSWGEKRGKTSDSGRSFSFKLGWLSVKSCREGTSRIEGPIFFFFNFQFLKRSKEQRLSNKWPSPCCPFSQQDVLVWPDRRTLMISLAGWAEILVGKKIDNFFKLSTFLFQLLLQWGVLPWCFKPLSNKTGRNKWLKAADHRYLINVKRTSWVLSNSLQNWRLHASLQREIFHIFFLRRRHWGFGQKVIMRPWEVVGPPEFIIEHSGNCHLEPL